PCAGRPCDTDETAGHAEFVAGAETAGLIAGRAFDEHFAAADAGGEQGAGIAADVEPAAAHVAAGSRPDGAIDVDGPVVELGTDEIEPPRSTFKLHGVTGLA